MLKYKQKSQRITIYVHRIVCLAFMTTEQYSSHIDNVLQEKR